MLEVMVHRFESIHQEKSGSWMDVNQKAEKTSLGTLSGNWPEDEVMGRSSRQGGGGSICAENSTPPFINNRASGEPVPSPSR